MKPAPGTTNVPEVRPPVLTGYIPDKFGPRQITIEATHPLAQKLVTTLPPTKTK